MGGLITTDDLDGIDYTTDGETFEIARATLVYANPGAAISSVMNQSILINGGYLVSAASFIAVSFGGDEGVITNTVDGNIRGSGGVRFSGSGLSLENRGDIEGITYAVSFESFSSGGVLTNIGTIFGREKGIWDRSTDGAAITNAGTISSEGFGIEDNSSVGCTINNTGIIDADQVAIRVATANGQTININNGAGGVIDGDVLGIIVFSGRLVLTNNGTINGGVWLFDAVDNDVIVNKGIIRDGVDLGEGNDVYTGSAIDVFGSFGNDTLTGAKGPDQFDGGDGDDVLTGNRGKDFLTGGLNADRFDFNSAKDSVKGANRDQILDFQRGQDHIDLRTIPGKFDWIGKQDFHDKKGELRYIDKGSTVIVQGDVNGDGKADFEIFVKVGALAKGDFLL